ncbi:MAG: hypothetical protein WB760_00340 [Xanthobacteraceae bacterium]
MSRDQQFHAGRLRAYARAVDVRHENEGILSTALYAIASAIIVLWLAYLSSVTATVLSKLNILPEHLSYSETVNRLHKTDRLTMAPFDDRWNAFATSGKPDAAQRSGRIPDGCEPAFSGLVKAGNFSWRCVT